MPGSKGWGEDSDPLIVLASDNGLVRHIPTPAGNYLSYYSALRDAILGEGPNPVTPEQATVVMTIIEAGIRSSREERIVELLTPAGPRP